MCISMQNFVEMGQTIAEMRRDNIPLHLLVQYGGRLHFWICVQILGRHTIRI